MKTNLFIVLAFCLLNLPVFGGNSEAENNSKDKILNDTIVITTVNKEVYICTCKPDTCNPGGEGEIFFQGKYEMKAGTEDADAHNCDERFLMQWDLSELPVGIEIVEAEMELVCISFKGDKQGQLIYEYITEPWNADIGFNSKPNTSNEGRVFTQWPTGKQYHHVDITDFIKKWYSNEIPNYGLMGYSIDTETTNSALFCSPNFPQKDVRPKLIVIFSAQSTVLE